MTPTRVRSTHRFAISVIAASLLCTGVAHATGELAREKSDAPPAETTAAPAAAEAPATPAPAGTVARAVVTHGVEDREPIDDVTSVGSDTRLLFFFTDLRDLAGTNVVHQWKRGDETMAEVAFHVGGPRWRVWSTKNFDPSWTGAWSVQVVNEDGDVLARRDFSYVTVARPEPAAAPEPPAAAPEAAAAP